MKIIRLVLRPNGSVMVSKTRLFETENLATTLIIDYSRVEDIANFYKFVDFKMGDGTSFTLPSLGDETTADTLSFELRNIVTKRGILTVQPYAMLQDGEDLIKVIFSACKLDVEDFVLSENDVTLPEETLTELLVKVNTITIDLDTKVDKIEGYQLVLLTDPLEV